MARPLQGVVSKTSTGWQASCPRRRGARERVKASFATEGEARRWLRIAVTDIAAGLDATGPSTPACPSEPLVSHDHSFGAVGAKYVHEHYVQAWKGDVGRQRTVEAQIRTLESFFASRSSATTGKIGLTIPELTRDDVLAALVSFARSPEKRGAFAVPDGLDPDAEIGLDEVLSLPGMPSRSTLRRRVNAGQLVGRAVGERVLYRVGDLYHPAAELLGPREGDGRSPLPVGPARKYGMTGAVVAQHRHTLERVLTYARATHVPVDPTLMDALPTPVSDRPKPTKRTPVTLTTCAVIAGRLHTVHMLVLWILRTLGLRIGECYGLRVGDVSDHGPGEPGMMLITAQGGKRSERRNRQTGTVEWVDRVEHPKNDSSIRALLVPPSLMVLIRHIVTAFHTDPETGEVDETASRVCAKPGSAANPPSVPR